MSIIIELVLSMACECCVGTSCVVFFLRWLPSLQERPSAISHAMISHQASVMGDGIGEWNVWGTRVQERRNHVESERLVSAGYLCEDHQYMYRCRT